MIDLKTRQKYINFTYIKKIVLFLVNLPISIFGIVILLINIISNSEMFTIPPLILIILICISMVVSATFIIVDACLKNKFRKMAIIDFFEIVNETNLTASPKVVYVYTCHNDMIPSRLLQNMQQTYKNMEVWISDGSDNVHTSKEVEAFANKHNIKYYKVGEKGSQNKSENLNSFIAKSGAVFDYLLITDSDEALDSHFVEYALKCFASPKFKNLGFVSALNYYYDTRSLYTNCMLNQVNVFCWKIDFTKTFSLNNISNLYSASCLVSQKLLLQNNNKFPEGCLEDYFLEHCALSKGFASVILPIAPCGQEFDKTFYATIKRNFRIFDWQIYLFKTNVFSSYNEKYSKWYDNLFLVILSVPIMFLGIVIAPWILWFIIINFQKLFTSPLFIALFSSVIVLLICVIVGTTIGVSKKTVLNKWGHLGWIFSAMYGLGCLPWLIKHWFNSTIRGRYSDFSSNKNVSGNQKKPAIAFILSSLIIVGVSILFALLNLLSNKWFLILFIYLIFLTLIVFLSSLSILIMNWSSKKIVNPSFDINTFIYPKDFYRFEKIKGKYKTRKGGSYD